jgi:hypothetical protein
MGALRKTRNQCRHGRLADWLLTGVPRAWPRPSPQHLPQLRNHARKVISKQLSGTWLRPSALEFTQSLSVSELFSKRDYLIGKPGVDCSSTTIGLLRQTPLSHFRNFEGLSDPAWLLASRAYLACELLYQLIEGLQVSTPQSSYLIVAETIIRVCIITPDVETTLIRSVTVG